MIPALRDAVEQALALAQAEAAVELIDPRLMDVVRRSRIGVVQMAQIAPELSLMTARRPDVLEVFERMLGSGIDAPAALSALRLIVPNTSTVTAIEVTE